MSLRQFALLSMLGIAGISIAGTLIRANLIGLLFLIPVVAAWFLLDGANFVADVRDWARRVRQDRAIEHEFRRQLREVRARLA